MPSQEPSSQNPPSRQSRDRVLLAYFSRAGRKLLLRRPDGPNVGNAEVLAGMIRDRLDCEVHRIGAADPYPDSYDATVTRNVREQNGNARPAIANPMPAIDQYDTVLLASGIWNVRAPMIMTTFAESYDFTGKTIHPITTHAMSGLGNTESDYANPVRRGHRPRTGGERRGSQGRRSEHRILAATHRTPRKIAP